MNLTPSAPWLLKKSTPDPASFYASHVKIAGRDQGEQGDVVRKSVQNPLAL